MKTINFPQANAQLGDEQTKIPVFKHRDGTIITCFELSDGEIKKLRSEKKIWLVISTYNEPIQPVSVRLDSPFEVPKEANNNG